MSIINQVINKELKYDVKNERFHVCHVEPFNSQISFRMKRF